MLVLDGGFNKRIPHGIFYSDKRNNSQRDPHAQRSVGRRVTRICFQVNMDWHISYTSFELAIFDMKYVIEWSWVIISSLIF